MSDECKEVEKTVEEKLTIGLNSKLSNREFDTFKRESFEPTIKNINDWLTYLRYAFFLLLGAISGMYLFYFTGVGSANKEMATKINSMEMSLALIQQQVVQISKILGNADITTTK